MDDGGYFLRFGISLVIGILVGFQRQSVQDDPDYEGMPFGMTWRIIQNDSDKVVEYSTERTKYWLVQYDELKAIYEESVKEQAEMRRQRNLAQDQVAAMREVVRKKLEWCEDNPSATNHLVWCACSDFLTEFDKITKGEG